MEPAEPEPFRTMFFEEFFRLFGGLNHLFEVVAFEARQLRDRHRVSLHAIACRSSRSGLTDRSRGTLRPSVKRHKRHPQKL
jgi:hypothetical protein